jgi:hypothetical protein
MVAPALMVAEVMVKSFDRLKKVESMELFGVLAVPRKYAKTFKVQLLQLIHDQLTGSVVSDGMLVDCATAHTPAAVATTVTGAKTSTVSEGLLGSLAVLVRSFKANNITLLVWTMLDESNHSLPGSLSALKPIVEMIMVEDTLCLSCTHM